MKKILTVAGTLLLVLAIAIPVLAHGPGWGKGHHRIGRWKSGPGCCWNYGRVYENLTEEQRSQLDGLYQKFHDERTQLRNEIQSKRAELNILLNSPNPDAEKAKALQKEISDLRAKMAQERINLRLEARKIAPELRFGRGYRWGYYGHHMRGHSPGMGHGLGGCWS